MSGSTEKELQAVDFRNALKDLDTYIDVSVDDLMQINRLATQHAHLREAEQILVRDLMTADVLTVQPDTPVKDAAGILINKRISGLPVLNNNNQLVGIVTEADFLTAMGIPSHHPSHSLWQTLESMFKNHQHRQIQKPHYISEIMITDVVTIEENDILENVIEKMQQRHVKRLVVTDEQQHVKGIITRSNLVQVLLQRML